MLQSHIGRLRVIGFTEGLSYLLLLGIAMPMKYLMDMPAAVKYVGWIHGLLFIGYVTALGAAALAHRWSLWLIVKALLAAVLPFGPFVFDRELRREQEGAIAVAAAAKVTR